MLIVVASPIVRCCAIKKNGIVASLLCDVTDGQFNSRLRRGQLCSFKTHLCESRSRLRMLQVSSLLGLESYRSRDFEYCTEVV